LVNVGIIGPGTIGKIHARIFHSLGATIVSTLSRTKESACRAETELFNELGIHVAGASNWSDFFSNRLDAVSICSPPETHLTHILQALDRSIPVFCEKPLISVTQDRLYKEISRLRHHKNRFIHVNTSNVSLLNYCELPVGPLNEVTVDFFSGGAATGISIGQDLLPHAFSVTRGLGLSEVPTDIQTFTGTNQFRVQFSDSNVRVEFDLRCSTSIPKKFEIGINGRQYERIQEGQSATYKVYMLDHITKNRTRAEDPFRAYISKFLADIGDTSKNDHFDDDIAILLNCEKILSVSRSE
jgi:hypothetical protein